MIAWHLLIGAIGLAAWGYLVKAAWTSGTWPALLIAVFFCVVCVLFTGLNIAFEAGWL